MSDYEWIDVGRRREQILLTVMDKPRMPSEAREILGYKKGNKLSQTFHELMARQLVHLLAKDLYGLTKKGQCLRRRLLHERNLTYSYVEPQLDWNVYRWVIFGRQRKVLLRVLQRHPIIAAQLLKLARQIHVRLSRTDTYNVLKQCVKKKVAASLRQQKNVLYSLTKKGEAVKIQIMAIWFAMFVFY